MATTDLMDVEDTYDENEAPPHPPDQITHDPHVAFLDWKANMDRLHPIDPPREPPPKPPDPPKPNNAKTYTKLISQRWDELIGKSKKESKQLNTKSSSSTFAYTVDEIMEDNMVTNMVLNINVHIRFQCDGGANTSVTNDHSILHHVVDIQPYLIGGIGAGITCTKKGTFYLQCEKGKLYPYICSILNKQQIR